LLPEEVEAGIAMPRADVDLIKRRLLIASQDYRKRTTEKK